MWLFICAVFPETAPIPGKKADEWAQIETDVFLYDWDQIYDQFNSSLFYLQLKLSSLEIQPSNWYNNEHPGTMEFCNF